MNFINLEKFLDSLVTEIGIPGVDCIVYYKNRPVFRHATGYADRENNIKMKGGELYNLYSTSKVITCTCALTLFEKGKFLMNDPLYEYLPEFADVIVKEKNEKGEEVLVKPKRPILIQDLFTMSAGLSYNLGTEYIKEVQKNTDGKAPTREIMKAIAKEPLGYHPGEHWGYSLAHDVIGGLIEVVSGKTFGEYLKESITEPLGIKNTGFERNDDIYSRMTAQYLYDYDKKYANRIEKTCEFCFGTEYESGGAGIISSVDDYGLFVNAMANGGIGANGNRIIEKCTVDMMRMNCLDEKRLKDFNWQQMSGYGYGYGVRTMIRPEMGSLGSVGEFGWGGAAGTYAMIDPDRQIGVFYGQHMKNNLEPYVHPRIRNLVYAALSE